MKMFKQKLDVCIRTIKLIDFVRINKHLKFTK